MLLEGKVAIVTGAARGTGKAIARRFVAEGATVALADVLVEQGEATAAKLGPAASFHELDVTDADGWAALVEGLVAEHGHVDVLVNNAAILHLGSIESTGLDTFRRVFDVNAAGAYAGIAAVAPHMRTNGSGSIVNIASIDGLQAMNGQGGRRRARPRRHPGQRRLPRRRQPRHVRALGRRAGRHRPGHRCLHGEARHSAGGHHRRDRVGRPVPRQRPVDDGHRRRRAHRRRPRGG